MTVTDNTKAQDFLATLPENLQSNEIFKDVEDVGQLAAKTHELGGKVMELTGELTTVKDSLPVVPETADGYEVTVADGMAASDELVKSLKAVAKDTGMTKAQASKMTEAYKSHTTAQRVKQVEAMNAAHAQEESDAENGLKDIWKEKYEPHMAAIQQVLHKFGTEEFKAELNKQGRGNSTHFAQFLLGVHGAMSEAVWVDGDPAGEKKMKLTKGGKPLFDLSKSMPEHYGK